MFTKSIFASVAFGAVGLVGIGYFWMMHSKKRCPREKEIEDLKEEVDILPGAYTWSTLNVNQLKTRTFSVVKDEQQNFKNKRSNYDINEIIEKELKFDEFEMIKDRLLGAPSTLVRPKESFNLSEGKWGYNLKYNGLASTKSILAHTKAEKKNTSHLLCVIADLVPVLKTDILFETCNTTRNEILKANITEFVDINYCSDITMLISLRDILNVLCTLKINPLVRSFTTFDSAQQQRDFNVFALRFPSREVLCTIYCSMLTHNLKAVSGDFTLRFKINFRDNALSVFIPKNVKLPITRKVGKITHEPSSKIKRRSDIVLNDINKTADTVLNQTSELTAVSEPKPDIPMKVIKLGNPVAMINQLIPCINYHHKIVSNPPSVVRVEAKIRDQFFEAEASTKKAAVMEICIEALEKFYNYEHVSAKIIE